MLATLDSVIQDLRYAARSLTRDARLTVMVAATLSVAIGASTALFTVVSSVLIAPLPFAQSERLVELSSGTNARGASWLDILDWRALTRDFDGVAAYATRPHNLLDNRGEPRAIEAAHVTPNLFPVLRVAPSLGRTFAADEQRGDVVVLGHGLWTRAFGGDRGVLGRPLRLDGRTYTVIGVLPAGFEFPEREVEVWLPIGDLLFEEPEAATSRGVRNLQAVARLAPAATRDQARADLDLLARRIVADFMRAESGAARPEADQRRLTSDLGFGLRPLREAIVGDRIRPALLMLLGAVALVLLIACVNTANLLLARAMTRRRDMAVRQALGAARARLVRQLLVESLMLALLSAGLGIALAYGSLEWLLRLWPSVLPRAGEIALNGQVLVVTSLVGAATGIGFGIVPAWRATAAPLEQVLRDEAMGTTSGPRRRLQGALVQVQVVISCVLLLGASLLMRSYIRLMRVDPGFDAHGVIVANVRLTPGRYGSGPQQTRFFEDLLSVLRARPGIAAASVASTLPFTGAAEMTDLAWFDPGALRPESPIMVAIGSTVTPEHFAALGIRLIRGRGFSDQDAAGSQRVVVVNKVLADTLWPGQDPVGKLLPLDNFRGGPGRPALVIGVANNVNAWSLQDAQLFPHVYFALPQAPALPQAWVVLRSARDDPTQLIGALRDAIRGLDAEQPIADMVTLEQIIGRTTAARRFQTTLLLVFALLALGLAIVGIYSLTAYTVSQRTRELGIRLALGARPGRVVAMLLRESLVRVSIGIAIGLTLAPAAGRMLTAMLFGVGTLDVAAYAITSVLFLAVAMLATWVPALRATRIDPVDALRRE